MTTFWKNKRVLLTGHTGFKGTWMSLMLARMGAKVCGYSLPLDKNSFFSRVAPDIYEHHEGDVVDLQSLEKVFSSFHPEIVLHFASHSSLKDSLTLPHYILRTNIMGVINVLELIRHYGDVKAVVIVTSDKCYLDRGIGEAYKEDAPLGGKDPYSTSKVCQELLSMCYAETFFQNIERMVGIATARASNVIGNGDDNQTRLFPYILNCYTKGELPKIRHATSLRAWQYVLDVLNGYLLLAERLFVSAGKTKQYNGAYNFGPDKKGFCTVGELTKLLGAQFGMADYETVETGDHIKKEAEILRLDSAKARSILQWVSKVTLSDAINIMADFAVREKKGERPKKLADEQVEFFLTGL